MSRRRAARTPTRSRRRSATGLGLLGALALVAAACSSPAPSSGSTTTTSRPPAATTTSSAPAGSAGLPPIGHVFVIMLENEGYAATFGDPAADPYLASTLPSQGALLEQYYGIGHFSNTNYVAFVSGQAPNPANQADCPTFSDFPASAAVGADGQISGSGCVFPASVPTLANQLTASGRTWKGYMEDMGNIPTREPVVCAHPAVGSTDGTEGAVPGDGYATRHDPFVYFHSIIDDPSLCDTHVVPLGTPTGSMPPGLPAGVTGLATDLRSVATTPAFSFITPNLCNDGHDTPCVNQPGQTSALTNVDQFLQRWVPLITGSPAFKKDGLLEITFDESPSSDTSACCNETPGPAAAHPGLSGPGGGRIGTVLLSPFIHPGTRSTVPYNHYSSLATIETIFGLPRLAEARTVSATFGADVFGGG